MKWCSLMYTQGRIYDNLFPMHKLHSFKHAYQLLVNEYLRLGSDKTLQNLKNHNFLSRQWAKFAWNCGNPVKFETSGLFRAMEGPPVLTGSDAQHSTMLLLISFWPDTWPVDYLDFCDERNIISSNSVPIAQQATTRNGAIFALTQTGHPLTSLTMALGSKLRAEAVNLANTHSMRTSLKLEATMSYLRTGNRNLNHTQYSNSKVLKLLVNFISRERQYRWSKPT